MVNKSGNKQLVARGLHKKQTRASERSSRGDGAAPTGVAGIAWRSAKKIVDGVFGGGSVRHRGPPKINGTTNEEDECKNDKTENEITKEDDDHLKNDVKNGETDDEDESIVVRPLREEESPDAVRFMKRLHVRQDMWEFYGHTLLQWRANAFLFTGGLFTYLWTGSWEMSLLSAGMFVAVFIVYLTYVLVQTPNNHPDLKDLYDYYSESHPKRGRLRRRFWVAVDAAAADRIVGTVAVDERTGDVAQLKRMFVDASFRQRGIGSKLVDRVVDFCRQNGYKEIVLYASGAQKLAQRLYERRGFARERSSMERILLWWFWEVCFYRYRLKSGER